MGATLHTDTEDLLERLTYVLAKSEDTKVAWVVGSGASHNIPGTKRMCEIMRAELGEVSSDETTPEEYRRLSLRLKRRRGNPGILNLLRAMVGEAYAGDLPKAGVTPADLTKISQEKEWSISSTHEAIAKVISHVPQDRRGPVFTTNFDTLLETALHRASIACQVVSQPNNSSIGIVGQHALPVIHLHGVWNDAAALNTDAELAWQRDLLESQLAHSLDQTLLVVIGYGGWDDSFSRTLKALVEEGYSRNSLEVVWVSHRKPADQGLLVDLQGNPSVVEYVASVRDIADHFQYRLSDATRPDVSLPAGIRLIWPPSIDAKTVTLSRFVDGSHPEIEASNVAPRLSKAIDLRNRAAAIADEGVDGAVVLTGPLGDGKTVSLQQAAMDLARGQEDVMLREKNAPLVIEMQRGGQVPPVDFWAGLREDYPSVFVIVDDADLVIERLLFRIRASRSKCLELPRTEETTLVNTFGNIVVLGAMHEQFRQTCRNLRAQEIESWDLVRTEKLSASEVSLLSDFWSSVDPGVSSYGGMPALAETQASSTAIERSDDGESLLGLLLTRWSGAGFDDRLNEIRSRLGRSMIGEVSSVDVLDAIAILHHHRRGYDDGASLGFLGELTGLRNLDLNRTVIRPLGREAAISRVGNIVLIRHEKIASRLVALMPEARYKEMCARISGVGGRMRKNRISGHECASLLCQKIDFPYSKVAAESALRASGLLESRVTYLKVLRKGGEVAEAREYASRLREHYREFSDWELSWRGLFIESSVCSRELRDGKSAFRLSLLAMSSLEGSAISPRNLEFGLVNAIISSRMVDSEDARRVERLSRLLLGRLPAGSTSQNFRLESTAPPLGELLEEFIVLARGFLRPKAPYFHDLKAVVVAQAHLHATAKRRV